MRRSLWLLGPAALTAAICVLAAASIGSSSGGPAVTSIYPVAHPRGLLVTTGGWAYCLQVQKLARRTRFELLCGRYVKDGYTGPGLRSQRHLDWGDPAYLADLAVQVAAVHARIGGSLVLLGISYSGFGVATLASHHPELRPDALIVIDSFLDLVARRRQLPAGHVTAHEIDAETGGSLAALRVRTVSVAGLARLVRQGTVLTVVWSTSPDEQKEFLGATCNVGANAGVLQQLADTLGRPVRGWVTQSRHGHDLWDRGRAIMAGNPPGRAFDFRPGGRIPPLAVCG